ncbi:MAG TPA: hypothetical protein DCX46_00185 [Bacteroidetes bacterium]|nr:hypothetical protein [Bacteroidota bacterium]
MNRLIPATFFSLLFVGLAVLGETGRNKNGPSFAKDVFPLIKSNCLPCHLAENENPSQLALDNYETMMKGGRHGDTVIPGKPKESNLYLKLLPNPPFGKQMARNRKKLTDEELKVIYDWIEVGAKKE